VDNDHITHRVLHVQLVSKIARTIGRALKLNEDLIEAISIGHDIGHVPFGHLGEKILSELCEVHGLGRFLHNVQSVQFLDKIEDCNLTLQVLDGILCHNGEIYCQSLKPNRDRNWNEFYKEIEKIKNGNKDYVPMTLEGCVVRFADIIAYIGRDIQDAKEIGIIDYSEIPPICQEIIGIENDKIINTLVIDVVENSYGQECISYSKEISDALEEYIKFSKERIYNYYEVLNVEEKITVMYDKLYQTCLEDLKKEVRSSKIYEHYINIDWISQEYRSNASDEEKVRDYIAGMTDRYFEGLFKEIMLPKRVTKFLNGEPVYSSG
jgi:dGTPase